MRPRGTHDVTQILQPPYINRDIRSLHKVSTRHTLHGKPKIPDQRRLCEVTADGNGEHREAGGDVVTEEDIAEVDKKLFCAAVEADHEVEDNLLSIS